MHHRKHIARTNRSTVDAAILLVDVATANRSGTARKVKVAHHVTNQHGDRTASPLWY